MSARRRGRPRGSGLKRDAFGKRARAIHLAPPRTKRLTVSTDGVVRQVMVRPPREAAAHYRKHSNEYRFDALDLAWLCRWAIEAGARRADCYCTLARCYGLTAAYVKRLHQRIAKAEEWPRGKAGRPRKK